jgi:hypothetical protein
MAEARPRTATRINGASPLKPSLSRGIGGERPGRNYPNTKNFSTCFETIIVMVHKPQGAPQ